jgi:hypothetical protein
MSQLQDFQALAQQGQELSAETLWPASLTFAGFPPISGARHAAPIEAALREGGFEESGVQGFRFLRSALPGGLVITPGQSTFTTDDATWRVVSLQDDPNQVHLRLVADRSQ